MIPVYQLLKAKKLIGDSSAALWNDEMYYLSNECSKIEKDIDKILKEIQKNVNKEINKEIDSI